MKEVVKLKSTFISSKPGHGIAAYQGTDGDSKLVEGILKRKSFYFQQRTGKLDMRAIGRVDVDRVVKEVDIDTLQAHLENITFADVTEDDLRLYSDQCFLNLFRLSQLLLEYLLSVQDTLATSLEALALKHGTLRKAVDKGRAELHATSEQARDLKRQVRQKRATLARYEQLLALPTPPAGGAAPVSGGSLHSCLTCGKMFTTTEFLQQHIVRKHAHQAGNGTAETSRESGETEGKKVEVEKVAFPSQLRLFVQTVTGQCLNMVVQGGATVSQLRGYINSTAGFAAAGPSKRLVYRGVQLHDDQTLKECNLPTDSQLVLLDMKVDEEATSTAKAQAVEKPETDGGDERESVVTTQMSTLLALMRQQLEWTMRSETGRREQGIEAAEALETRMRGMEASLPRRLEEFMEESVGGLKSSLRKALDDMEELQAKRSNAGALQDDEDETREREEKEKARLASLADKLEKATDDNRALQEELARAKAAVSFKPPATELKAAQAQQTRPDPAPTLHQAPESPPELPRPRASIDCDHTPPRKPSIWDLSFSSEGSRPAVTVKVGRTATCQSVCESIAAELDVAEARVVLRDNTRGDMVSPETVSGELLRLYEGDFLELEVLQGNVLSDNVVDGLVEFYERHVPVQARDSGAVSMSMAEIDLAAKRHVMTTAGQTGAGGTGGYALGDNGDATDHAEKQVGDIRAELSATLTRGKFPTKNTDLSKSISRTTPGLGLTFAKLLGDDAQPGAKSGVSDADIFGDEDDENVGLSRSELERAVEARKRARPAGIERQMENVSKSMEDQLNLLLEEAEQELEQLQQDSLGSETYSSTDPSVHGGAALAFADPPKSLRGSFQDVDAYTTDKKGDRGSSEARGSTWRENQRYTRRSNDDTFGGGGVVEDRDIYGRYGEGDWNKTLDTAVSIPEGPEERADEHEANASMEMMSDSANTRRGHGRTDSTALNALAD